MGKINDHPMNCTISFSFFEVNMAFQLHDQFRAAGLQSVFLAIFKGGNINSFPFSAVGTKIFGRILHRIRMRCWRSRMSFLGAPIIRYVLIYWSNLDQSIVNPPRSGFCLRMRQPRIWNRFLMWEESEFRFRKCHDTWCS